MIRLSKFVLVVLCIMPTIASAASIDFSCSGRSYSGVWQRDVFAMRLTVQSGVLTDWSFSGEVPFQLLAMQSMKKSVPFSQSCKITNGYPARACDFRVARASMILIQVEGSTKAQNMGFMIEQSGALPLIKRFKYMSYMGQGSGATDGICLAR